MNNRIKYLVGLAAVMASLVMVLPAEAAGGRALPAAPAPAAPRVAPPAVVPAAVHRASLVGNPAVSPAASGSLMVKNGPILFFTGRLSNAGSNVPAGTWVDLVIDGTLVQSSPIFPAFSAIFPGGTVFGSEPFRATAAPDAPLTKVLSAVHAGSSAVVSVSSSTSQLGGLINVPLSPLHGQVVAHGTFN